MGEDGFATNMQRNVTTPISDGERKEMGRIEASASSNGAGGMAAGESAQVEVVFVSQTGTAEEFAEDMTRELSRRSCSVACRSVASLALSDLTGVKVFVISTTGQGEMPHPFRELWADLLRVDCAQLPGLQFSIFGLGDSAYPEFNFAARKLQARLTELGAKLFHRVGFGDESHDFGLAQEFDPWLDELMDGSFAKYLGELGDARPLEVVKYEVERCGKGTEEEEDVMVLCPGGHLAYPSTVTLNHRLTSADHFQDVRHLHFATAAPFSAGDVAIIWPQASPAKVDKFLKDQQLDGDQLVKIRPVCPSSANPFPDRALSVRKVFTNFLDISAIPRRWFFECLAPFADDVHAPKLAEFGGRTPEDKMALLEYCGAESRTVAEVLWDFNSARPPLDVLISLVPPMQPRRYSIASAPYAWTALWKPGGLWIKPKIGLDVCAAIVEYKTKLQRQIVGVCSDYFTRLNAGDPVPISITPGTLRNPALDVPLIMVGPGTGLAPLRAVVQERDLAWKMAGRPKRRKDVLFLGFRKREKDFLFDDEWSQYSPWLDVNVCFSREPGEEHFYVQHKIEFHKERIGALLSGPCKVFVCGRAHPMPTEVFESFIKALVSVGFREDGAERRLKQMQASGDYVTDTWG